MGNKKFFYHLDIMVGTTAKYLNLFAAAILFCMMLLTVADVFLRKMYSRSIIGTVEATEFMLTAIIFLSLSRAEILNKHIRADFFLARFSGRTKKGIAVCTLFLAGTISMLLAWSAFSYAGMMRMSGEVSQDLLLPIYPVVFLVGIGFVMLAFVFFVKLLRQLFETSEL